MRNIKKRLLVVVLAFFTSFFSIYAWQNPMNLSGQAEMGIGDPYIFKFRGTYYLYSSSRNQEILCWTSKDLISWTKAVVCCSDATTYNSYAPEVVYWNGTFYMYASPAGDGHYVLTSNSPKGPFTAVTGNLGKSIDGSVFIDDDAKWYFYHANSAGIHGCAMSEPTKFGSSLNLNAQMCGQWTEAPCVFKRNGIYYLLYTGNHVWSNGYRVDYATNTSGPISAYTPQKAQNPILIKTEGSFYGLGHGTAFIGPDLDTYYFTYHNLVRIGGGSPPNRQFDYDRMAWNGDKMLMLGPTNWAQQNPESATSDFFDRDDIGANWTIPDGGNWKIVNKDLMSQDKTDAEYKAVFTPFSSPDYTAEFTVKKGTLNGTDPKLGALFSYTDEQNYGIVLLNSTTNQIEINFLVNNIWGTSMKYNLPSGFNHTVWHSIRIEKCNTNYKFFVDGLFKASLTNNLNGGKIGYVTRNCEGHFSYIAISDKVNGSGIFDTYKPVPGDIQAVHYNTGGEGVGYHDLTNGNAGNSGTQYSRKDDVDVSKNSNGGFHVSSIQAGEWYKYNVNVKSTGAYNVGIRYSTSDESSQIKIFQGDTELMGVITLPNTNNTWKTHTIKGLNLTVGYQTLRIEAVSGEFELYEMQFKEGNNEPVTITDTFDTAFGKNWNYTDGSWSIVSGMASINGYGKRALGNTGWTDYTIDCDITYIEGMNAGLIFRVNNPANGGENNNPQLGTDFLQGYFVGIGTEKITLGKQNYSWEVLATSPGSHSLNKSYHVRVVTNGANIKVYVDNMTTPKIDYTDSNPIISGKAGFRSHSCHVRFDNLVVTIPENSGAGIKTVNANQDWIFYPNPVKDMLFIQADENIGSICIYNLTGNLMYAQQDFEPVDMKNFPAGMYVVEVKNALGSSCQKIMKE